MSNGNKYTRNETRFLQKIGYEVLRKIFHKLKQKKKNPE